MPNTLISDITPLQLAVLQAITDRIPMPGQWADRALTRRSLQKHPRYEGALGEKATFDQIVTELVATGLAEEKVIRGCDYITITKGSMFIDGLDTTHFML